MVQLLSLGSDVVAARRALGFTQMQLAVALDIGLSTVRKHEASERLDTLMSLAVECLLRRAAPDKPSNARLTPEERAERRFAEAQHLRDLKATAETPTTIAQRQLAVANERKRLRAIQRRNDARAEQRPIVRDLWEQFDASSSFLNAKERTELIDSIVAQAPTQHIHVLAFLEFARTTTLISVQDPLVALPDEQS